MTDHPLPTFLEIAYNGGTVLLIGLLIGLERQHSQKPDEPLFAGFRTFPVIALTGFFAGLVGARRASLDIARGDGGRDRCRRHVVPHHGQGAHKGATTEFVAILTFIFGALSQRWIY